MQMILFIFGCMAHLVAGADNPGCTYPKHSSAEMKKGETQISTLKGKRWTASDKDFTYDIGICVNAISPIPDDQPNWQNAGVIQTVKSSGNLSYHVIGRIDQADIFAGPEWVMLEYEGGDKYGTHCGTESRRAKIMFICDPTVVEDYVIILEEQNEKDEDCYYLFEINTPVVCPPPKAAENAGLSIGSILLIVFFCVAAVYLLAGCLYNRFVLHAKGFEQIPHLSFWEDFGNLQADGCDLVCRSHKSRQPRTYKGVGDDQLGDGEQTNTDEHLLPM